MRQRIWHALFAMTGIAALAGTAAAQQPAPPVAYYTYVPPVPAAAAAAPTAPAPGSIVIPGNGGCNGCPTGKAGPVARAATATRGYLMEASGGYYGTTCMYGARCNNGAGSLHSDLGFLFGSSRSFFAPCGPEGLGCAKCRAPVYGHGASGPSSACQYDSYMNR